MVRRQVVPRTMESSMRTTRLPSTASRTGLSFRSTPSSRIAWVGAIKVRPTYRFFGKADGVGDAGGLGVAQRGIQAGVGHTDYHVRLHRVLLGQESPRPLPGMAHTAALDHRVWAVQSK